MTRTALQEFTRSASEDDLLTAITEAMTLFGWLWTHTRRSDKAQIMGHPGVPDIIAARRGRLLFLELKSAGGTLTEGQLAWKLAMPPDSRAVTYMLVYPADLDVVLGMLR